MSYTKNNEWFDPNRYTRAIRWDLFGRFLTYYTPYKKQVWVAAVLTLAFSGSAYLIPKVFGLIQRGVEARAFTLVLWGVGAYLGIVVVQSLANYAIIGLKAHISTRLNKDVLLNYYQHLLDSGVQAFLSFKRRSNLFQRVIDAMSTTGQVTTVLVSGLLSLVTVCAFGAVIGSLSLEVLLVLLGGSAVLGLYAGLSSSALRDRRQKTLGINYPLVSKMLEILQGLLTVKALSASVRVTQDIDALVSDKQQAEYAETEFEARLDLGTTLLRNGTLLGAVGTGFALFLDGALSLADLVAVYVLATGFLGPVTELVSSYKTLSVISVNLENYFQVIDIEPEDQPEVRAARQQARKQGVRPALALSGDGQVGAVPVLSGGYALDDEPTGHLVFDDVTFAYEDGEAVLDGLNCTIEAGENVALIGRSGAGKTTLMRVLLAFLDPQRGCVRVDGTAVHTLADKSSFRERFGIVGQDDFLFNISVRDNLVFGMHSVRSDDELEYVLRLVNLWDDIAARPEGLDTIFDADSFSGGQKQRLVIARALVRRPEIVLLDEPTSALDFENEQEVANALNVLVQGKTTLTIAHRLSTVQDADRVLVLDGGRVVAEGPHDVLYETNEYYRSLCDYNSFIV